jgi:uncharacterized protein YdhG (YjbR/CyaY superfamily)
MNMFKPTQAKNKADYIAKLPIERRNILTKLDQVIKNTVPELKEFYAYNMPGYGSFTYINYKKEEVKWPVISMASQKNYVSVYVCAVDANQYIAEKYGDELGNVSVGKSCIRFKKLEDLNIEVFKKVIKAAAKNPGLVYAGDKKKS